MKKILNELRWAVEFLVYASLALPYAAVLFAASYRTPENRRRARLVLKLPKARWDIRKDPSMFRWRVLSLGYDPDDPDLAETIARGPWRGWL